MTLTWVPTYQIDTEHDYAGSYSPTTGLPALAQVNATAASVLASSDELDFSDIEDPLSDSSDENDESDDEDQQDYEVPEFDNHEALKSTIMQSMLENMPTIMQQPPSCEPFWSIVQEFLNNQN
jgi:hypothetical protein